MVSESELFDYVYKNYCVIEGVLTNKNTGKQYTCTNKGGYNRVYIKGKLYYVHRVVWLLVMGEWPKTMLDHIDQNKQNNRFENLREVTQTGNSFNSKVRKDNTTGMRGLKYDKRDDLWYACVEVFGEVFFRKGFKKREDAKKHLIEHQNYVKDMLYHAN
jgi:hypothetical protein